MCSAVVGPCDVRESSHSHWSAASFSPDDKRFFLLLLFLLSLFLFLFLFLSLSYPFSLDSSCPFVRSSVRRVYVCAPFLNCASHTGRVAQIPNWTWTHPLGILPSFSQSGVDRPALWRITSLRRLSYHKSHFFVTIGRRLLRDRSLRLAGVFFLPYFTATTTTTTRPISSSCCM